MNKKVWVISLGGSLIAPDEMDHVFLKKFKKVIKKNKKNNKFVIVCGGGIIARRYIDVLKKEKKSEKALSLAGIQATCMNAFFMMEFFGKETNEKIPKSKNEVKELLKTKDVIFCCAFKYVPKQTSDGTAAELAKYLHANLINLSNVDGLYTSDPKTDKNARIIYYISWTDFEKKANEIKFSPGQHFVLDQKAAKLIKKEKIKTFLLGKNTKELHRVLRNKKYKGTLIGP